MPLNLICCIQWRQINQSGSGQPWTFTKAVETPFLLHESLCKFFIPFSPRSVISFPSQRPESICYKLHNDRRPCWSEGRVTQRGQASFLFLLDPLSLRMSVEAPKARNVSLFPQVSQYGNQLKVVFFSHGGPVSGWIFLVTTCSCNSNQVKSKRHPLVLPNLTKQIN